MDFIKAVIELKEKHKDTWRDEGEFYWLGRLIQEVGELGSAVVGDHTDPVEWELMQISAICMNWLEMRLVMMEDTKGFENFIKHRAEIIESGTSKKLQEQERNLEEEEVHVLIECLHGGLHNWIAMDQSKEDPWCSKCGVHKDVYEKSKGAK